MYQEFFINKQSGTYAETLEAFGVANLISEIFQRNETKGFNVTITDKGLYYLIKPNKSITNEMVDELTYFQVVKFILKDDKVPIPSGISEGNCFNYPKQKIELDDYKKRFEDIEKNKQLTQEQKKLARKTLNKEKTEEFGQKIDAEFDVYREIIKNPYASFLKLFDNFYQNKSNFQLLIRCLLNHYCYLR